MNELSIIVPNYNNEDYIEDCLKSIVSYPPLNEKLEVIIIDDGSTDNSVEVIENFIKKCNVRMYLVENEKNRGAGYSRNRGINVSSCKYVAFVDSDDMIIPEVLYDCLEIISTFKNEVVFYDICDLINNEFKSNPYSEISMYGFDKYNVNIDKKEKPNIMFGWSSCRFIIDKDFLTLNKLKFCDGSLCEDACFVSDMYSKMHNISVVNKPGYIYRIKENVSPDILNDMNLKFIFKLFDKIMSDSCYNDILYYQLLYLCLPLLLERKDLNVHQICLNFLARLWYVRRFWLSRKRH